MWHPDTERDSPWNIRLLSNELRASAFLPPHSSIRRPTSGRCERGCPGQSSSRSIDAFGHRDFFVRLLGTTSGHLSRLYGRKSLGAARTEGLLDTLRIFAAAAAAFGGLERAQDWLGTALPALGGDRPIDLCDTFEGRRLVQEIIRKVEYGEFP